MSYPSRRPHRHHIIHATGSAGTQAGLVTGLAAMHTGIPVLGVGVRASKAQQEDSVFHLAEKTAEHVGAAGVVKRRDVIANCDYVGDGYGIPTEAMVVAVTSVARTEGILLDPVYTGKGMAGLIDLTHKGMFAEDKNIVFLHTGGSAGLFVTYARARPRSWSCT